MSLKKKPKAQQAENLVEKVPLMARPKFNLFYTMIVITLFSAGILMLILSYSIFSDTPAILFVSLGILGLGIILLTMRSSYKSTSPSATQEEAEEKKDDSGLKMRNR